MHTLLHCTYLLVRNFGTKVRFAFFPLRNTLNQI